MDKYNISGVDIEFDVCDMDCLERYFEELNHYDEEVHREIEGETIVQHLRRDCEAVMDFFDTVVGEGTAEQIFGNRTNVRVCLRAISSFIVAVNKNISSVNDEFTIEMEAPMNRAQRRAAARKQ